MWTFAAPQAYPDGWWILETAGDNKLYPRTETIHTGAIKRIVYSTDIFINNYVK